MTIDRAGLAEFLRQRRRGIQPQDVGLPRGSRRRTDGLRREEVAVLCHMSTDYYTRLEQQRGPHPSQQMIASIAQGLHLSLAERDHLYHLAGHPAPVRGIADDHVSPGLLRILDRLQDTPAEVVTEIGETLLQTPLGVALTGVTTQYSGPSRSICYRWFAHAHADERRLYAAEDHPFLSRLFASGLRESAARLGPGSRAAQYAERLLAESEEFRTLWNAHVVGVRPEERKRFVHPVVGEMTLSCQSLVDPEQSHLLLVYTATPGTESYERLRLLSVVGSTSFA